MVKIRQSTIIDAPVDAVWDLLRDFNGHDRWHPAIASSEIEGGAPVDAIGSVRDFKLSDGSRLREQLLALSDSDRTLTYCLLEAPLPLMGYVATIRLKPVTDGERTFWEWHSEFNPPPDRREELTRLVSQDIYRAGFAAIRQRFGGGLPASQRAASAPAGNANRPTPTQATIAAAQQQRLLPHRHVPLWLKSMAVQRFLGCVTSRCPIRVQARCRFATP